MQKHVETLPKFSLCIYKYCFKCVCVCFLQSNLLGTVCDVDTKYISLIPATTMLQTAIPTNWYYCGPRPRYCCGPRPRWFRYQCLGSPTVEMRIKFVKHKEISGWFSQTCTLQTSSKSQGQQNIRRMKVTQTKSKVSGYVPVRKPYDVYRRCSRALSHGVWYTRHGGGSSDSKHSPFTMWSMTHSYHFSPSCSSSSIILLRHGTN